MTALIGGSILLIAAAAVALVFGWIGADEKLIWTSIVCSVAAAVCLALGYHRSKQEVARAGRRPPASQEPAPEPASPADDAP